MRKKLFLIIRRVKNRLGFCGDHHLFMWFFDVAVVVVHFTEEDRKEMSGAQKNDISFGSVFRRGI